MLRKIFLMTTVIASAMVGSAYAADLGYRPALRKTGSKLAAKESMSAQSDCLST